MGKPRPKQITWIEGNNIETGYVGSTPTFTIMKINRVSTSGLEQISKYYVFTPMSMFRLDDSKTFDTIEGAKVYARQILAGLLRWILDYDELNT